MCLKMNKIEQCLYLGGCSVDSVKHLCYNYSIEKGLMSKPIILTEHQWCKLRVHLSTEYPASVMAIRSKMKKVLGFTVREHTQIVESHYSSEIHLDFYNEAKRTMFLLKYSELTGC